MRTPPSYITCGQQNLYQLLQETFRKQHLVYSILGMNSLDDGNCHNDMVDEVVLRVDKVTHWSKYLFFDGWPELSGTCTVVDDENSDEDDRIIIPLLPEMKKAIFF